MTLLNSSLERLSRAPQGIVRRWQSHQRRVATERSFIRVPVDNLLMGGERSISAGRYAELTDDFLRPSTRVADGPHTQLLRDFERLGKRIFESGVFEQTAYYKNAYECIDIMGRYFLAQEPEQIRPIAERFIKQHIGEDISHLPSMPGQSPQSQPITVRPIKFSSCYEVLNGHHRIARAIMNGERGLTVLPKGEPTLTPLQKLLLDVLWTDDKYQIYQPIDAPELKDGWTLIRRCADRLSMMEKFLLDQNMMPPRMQTYIDIGASYGWFIARLRDLGFESYGVERDPMACKVGQMVYGNKTSQIFRADCVRFLRENNRVFDVVSSFSLLHHFALGRGSVTAEELIRMIDKVTGKILFFDTGQNHEKWFRDRLPEWSVDFIEAWLKRNTTFKSIVRLGTDSDAVPPFEDNYNRMLFACVR